MRLGHFLCIKIVFFDNRALPDLKNRALTTGKEQILENLCFRKLRNRAPTNGNNNILENRFFALLRNRALTNGKEPILENPCFRNLRNRALTIGNNNILENDCFAIPNFVLSPMEITIFLKIINFCLHTSCHAAFSKIVSSPMVRARILHFELRA